MISQVHPGIYRLNIPVPGALKSMNSYLLQGQDGWTVIDPGPNLSGCRERWETALTDINVRFEDIDDILVTHGHIDHVGLAGWLQQKSGAVVWMTEKEYASAFHPRHEQRIGSEHFETGMLRLGLTPEEISSLVNILGRATTIIEPWPQATFVQEKHTRFGDRDWQVILTRGHTDCHICLFNSDEKILLSGDQVLPTISTVIRFPTSVQDNPLHDYLESLRTLRQLSPNLVLPAHGEPFRDMEARIEQLFSHHDERLRLITDCLTAGGTHTREISDYLFGSDLDAFNRFLATGEIFAHLLLLISQGKISVSADPQSDMVTYSLSPV